MSLTKNIQEWGRQLSSALWFLGTHAFVATLLFVLAAGVIAALLFYQYAIFSVQLGEGAVASEFEFKKELFEDLLSQMEQEATRVKEADLSRPPDLFNP